MHGSRLIHILAAWGVALAASGAFLFVVYRYAPYVLENDRNTSVWYLNSLAEECWREFDNLPPDAAVEQKQKLLDQAAGYLRKAAALRPDAQHYQWFLLWTLYREALLTDPPDGARLSESICMAQALWEKTGKTWSKPALFLADHFLDQKQDDQALPFLEAVHRQESKNLRAIDGLIRIAVNKGEDEHALQLLHEKESIAHLSTSERDLLVTLLARQEVYREAADRLSTLVTASGSSRERWFLYALVCAGVQDRPEALRAMSVYLSASKPREPWPSAEALGLERIPDNLLPILTDIYRKALSGSHQMP
ncbi:MAG: hypothetical protein DIKNOCCD_02340 [bacterium]|nr:hypothetical protein [bacterium]MBV6482590.1 hypothetical protein [bacterium]MCE7907150.1 hypothetical protein [Candidatus Omnitrophica bacterium COP1]